MPNLHSQIADVIGDDHPDLTALIERIQRANQTPFDTAAATLALLKAGMPTDVVMGGGLDAASRLSLVGGIGAEEAAELVVTTVNTFGLGPKYLPSIPNYVANIRYRASLPARRQL